jgi:hypothetical protein
VLSAAGSSRVLRRLIEAVRVNVLSSLRHLPPEPPRPSLVVNVANDGVRPFVLQSRCEDGVTGVEGAAEEGVVRVEGEKVVDFGGGESRVLGVEGGGEIVGSIEVLGAERSAFVGVG